MVHSIPYAQETIVVVNILFIIISLFFIISAQRKFYRGVFKNLIGWISVLLLLLTGTSIMKLVAVFNPDAVLFGHNIRDVVFEYTLINPILLSIVFLIIAYMVVELSRVQEYGKETRIIIERNGHAHKGSKK